jgi:drug/metabolite transporter (DMT)-like permease
MSVVTAAPHDVWNRDERSESRTQRLDRNWACLLQELRVVLTGVQLLSGFLLTLPFQQRFTVLNEEMRLLYLATVTCSVAATVLLTTPVALHRMLFRRHRLSQLVTVSHRLTMLGLLLLGAAVSGVATIVFGIIGGGQVGIAAGTVIAVLWISLWVALPLAARRGTRADVLL